MLKMGLLILCRADSVTWNPHKLLAASQQCSTFLTRHQQVLAQCHSTNATYLFQKGNKVVISLFFQLDQHKKVAIIGS